MGVTRGLFVGLLIVLFQQGDASAQRPTNTSLRGTGCLHEGLIATGLFNTKFNATQTTYEKSDTIPTGFRLLCEKQQLILEHQEYAGQKATDPDHWYEYWGVVASARDTLAFNTLRVIFARVGASNTVGVLTMNDNANGGPSVLFAVEAWYLTRKFFGRLTYVAPEYLRDIPMPKGQ